MHDLRFLYVYRPLVGTFPPVSVWIPRRTQLASHRPILTRIAWLPCSQIPFVSICGSTFPIIGILCSTRLPSWSLPLPRALPTLPFLHDYIFLSRSSLRRIPSVRSATRHAFMVIVFHIDQLLNVSNVFWLYSYFVRLEMANDTRFKTSSRAMQGDRTMQTSEI